MSFKGFALPRPEKVLTDTSRKAVGSNGSRNNSFVALQTFIDVTKFSLITLISVSILEFFIPVRKSILPSI